MFAVGHMSLGYLLGKGSSLGLRVKVNVPLVMVLSLIPDVDIIYDYLTGAQIHRGPTHSVVVAVVAFVPFFVVYGRRAFPYFLALVSHSVFGDLLGGGVQLLWPVSNARFGLPVYFSVFSVVSVVSELVLFVLALFVLFRSGDWRVFFSGDWSNLLLVVPVFTVLLPTLIGFPFEEPLVFSEPVLAAAHLFYLVLFLVALVVSVRVLFRRWFGVRHGDG